MDEKRAEYRHHAVQQNLWVSSAQYLRKNGSEPQAYFTKNLASYHLIERGTLFTPAYLYENGLHLHNGHDSKLRPNLSTNAERYLDHLGMDVEDLFYYVLATLHAPTYREANAGALRMGWPRIPLPDWPNGNTHNAAEVLAASAVQGRELAALLDSNTPVDGITQGALRAESAAIAVPSTITGNNMTDGDFVLAVGWGHFGAGDAVMPGRGRVIERTYSIEECDALDNVLPTLGETTLDVYLNGSAYWRNVPIAVWNYKLGGYQVLKKWLSYREHSILGRALSPEEVQHFVDTARRIAAILILTEGK